MITLDQTLVCEIFCLAIHNQCSNTVFNNEFVIVCSSQWYWINLILFKGNDDSTRNVIKHIAVAFYILWYNGSFLIKITASYCIEAGDKYTLSQYIQMPLLNVVQMAINIMWMFLGMSNMNCFQFLVSRTRLVTDKIVVGMTSERDKEEVRENFVMGKGEMAMKGYIIKQFLKTSIIKSSWIL